ncbi:MAG: hypothetical protein IT203_03810 [Fimbriimonadaceae bacterium]|nr:hypothetical protein [Fimbriimonadaceae bacterium]
MNEGSYENDVVTIRGDVFIDRILGWLSLFCALPVLGLSISKLLGHLPEGVQPDAAWIEPTRMALIVLAMVGIYIATKSTYLGFKLVAGIFAFRLVASLVLSPWTGSPRYLFSEILFDLVVLAYSFLRMRRLAEAEA